MLSGLKGDALTVGVYLGSQCGEDPAFKESVILLGKGLVELGYTLVYGGSSVGLMGVLASTVKEAGGKAIGIITQQLMAREILFTDLDELFVVDSMYERKRLIHEKSSRFLMLPGGIGTFDEFMETWCQIKIGLMNKALGILNINSYFDSLISFISQCKHQGFLSDDDLEILRFYSSAPLCLEDLARKEINTVALNVEKLIA